MQLNLNEVSAPRWLAPIAGSRLCFTPSSSSPEAKEGKKDEVGRSTFSFFCFPFRLDLKGKRGGREDLKDGEVLVLGGGAGRWLLPSPKREPSSPTVAVDK